MSDLVTDQVLIDWFEDEYKKIDFITFKPAYERVNRSSRLETLIEKLRSGKELVEHKQTLIDIWKDLVANAIIFLKSKDDREYFHDDGDYGIEDLGKFFDSYCDFEKLLYGSGEFYRDHVLHVFRVFLLGEHLIRKHLVNEPTVGKNSSNGFKYLDVMDLKLKNESAKLDQEIEESLTNLEEKEAKLEEEKGRYLVKPEEKEAMWCIVSLTHDLGYPTEVVHEIHDKLKNMLDVFNIQDVSYILSQQGQLFNDNIIKIISSDLELCKRSSSENPDKYTTHSQAKYYLKYSRSIEKWDHGVESCIVLVKTLVYFLETDFSLDKRRPMKIEDARQFLIRQRILRAIASHNCDFIYHLKLDLSFLLRIVDEMQEWNRPKLTDLFTKSPQAVLKINKFERNIIDYIIQFNESSTDPDNEEKLHKNIKEYFYRKIKKFTMILRSAVDGEKRNSGQFVLVFNVIDSISRSSHNQYKYTFTHKNPEDIKIKLQKHSKTDVPIELELLKDERWNDFKNEYFKDEEWTKKKSNTV